MDQRSGSETMAGPVIMLISAAIFGYFGFLALNWNTPGVDGQPVFFRVLCGWTLKATAIAFAASVMVTFAAPLAGNLLYALVGLISAVLLVVVAIMDLADTRHTIMPYAPVVLLAFAAWNGWGSYASLRQVAGLRRRGSADAVLPPDRL